MITIKLDLDNLFGIPGETRSFGRFTRTDIDLPSPGNGQEIRIVRDKRDDSPFVWMSVAVLAEKDQEICFVLEHARFSTYSASCGWVIQGSGMSYLLPAEPRCLALDDHRRIHSWTGLPWQLRHEGQRMTLVIRPTQTGWAEFICVRDNAGETAGLMPDHPLAQETYAVEGCWSRLTGARDFWQFWALGAIYSGRHAAHGRFLSPQTAWSLYKIASVLAIQSGHGYYDELMAEIAYTTLATLGDDGDWQNGEWLAEMETHLRFQLDGVHLLLTAYEQLGDTALLEGARRAAAFALRARDELDDGSWWFLHDTLELNYPLLVARYPFFWTHQHFGKQPSTTLTLNTHLSALHVFFRLAHATRDPVYQEAYAKGMQALRRVFDSASGKLAHRVAEWLMELSFEYQLASWPRRGLRYLVRRSLRARLTGIHLRWPSFMTPGGYLWRDMALPGWGYWYHLVNLYDLLQLYQLDPQPWLRLLIDRAMAYTLQSNLVPYLLAQRHYIAPQWIQILAAYTAINPEFDSQLVDLYAERIRALGYGVPPEVYRGVGSEAILYTQDVR
jgi:hypothetical protein